MKDHIHDGITIQELISFMYKQCGISAEHCYGLVQRIKTELDMYSPDSKHLYINHSPDCGMVIVQDGIIKAVGPVLTEKTGYKKTGFYRETDILVSGKQ